MKLKTFSAAVLAALFLMHSFAPPALADNNECTYEDPCRGSGTK